MYKGRTYCSDKKGNHEQVKRLPDDDFVDLFDCVNRENNSTTVATFTTPYTANILNVPEHTSIPQSQKDFIHRPTHSKPSTLITASRFANIDLNSEQLRQLMSNTNTVNKTKGNFKVLKQFLDMKQAHRGMKALRTLPLLSSVQYYSYNSW